MRTQVLSYGGGVQTAAMVALVMQGKIEKPDMIVIADTGREKTSTWDYMNSTINPALAEVGMEVEIAPHSLATVDLYSGNGDLLVPGFTETGKLPTFCSNEWKARVVKRYLRSKGVEQCDMWVGFSRDEEGRAKPSDVKWAARRFPLLEVGMNRADCISAIVEMGWPIPMKSACRMCPNMSDAEWAEMKEKYPGDFEQAARDEEEFIEWDNIYLHKSRVPLGNAVFRPEDSRVSAGHHQCSMGFCFL